MNTPAASGALRVAVAGLGSIGGPLAEALDRGVPGLELVAVSARDVARARARMERLSAPVEVRPAGDLAAVADVIVECAPSAVFAEIAEPVVDAGRIFMPLSVGALLERQDLVERARSSGARIVVPSGAILGLDAIRGAAEGTIESVTHVTRKPPRSLKGAPWLERNGITLDGLSEPLCVFSGSVREGARAFPANVNVSAAVSLAGIGPDRTRLEVWADPALERNTHKVTVEADSARFTVSIETVPSPENPATGKLTPLSVLATLRGLAAPLRIGT